MVQPRCCESPYKKRIHTEERRAQVARGRGTRNRSYYVWISLSFRIGGDGLYVGICQHHWTVNLKMFKMQNLMLYILFHKEKKFKNRKYEGRKHRRKRRKVDEWLQNRGRNQFSGLCLCGLMTWHSDFICSDLSLFGPWLLTSDQPLPVLLARPCFLLSPSMILTFGHMHPWLPVTSSSTILTSGYVYPWLPVTSPSTILTSGHVHPWLPVTSHILWFEPRGPGLCPRAPTSSEYQSHPLIKDSTETDSWLIRTMNGDKKLLHWLIKPLIRAPPNPSWNRW